MRVLNTDDPHINEARLRPRRRIMRIDTSRFSPPRSPRTREGIPCFCMAATNTFKTVSAELLVLALRPVAYGVAIK